MDWIRSKTRAIVPSKGTSARTSSDGRSTRPKSHPPQALASKSVAMAATDQTHGGLARNQHQDVPSSSADTISLRINEQVPHDTESQRSRNLIDEAPTTTSERARDTGNTNISVYGISAPRESRDSSRSHVLNSAITSASHIQGTGKENQNVSSFFPYARDFQINNSTFIEVNPGSDTQILSFTESQDGQKLKRALVEGLEFIPLANECMQDTRVGILSDVDARIRDSEGTNLIWIKGFPGVGKSTLASTIVSRLRKRGELLSYFVFDRAKPTVTTTTALWRRVAWDLVRLHSFARQPLLKRIDDETLDINTPNVGSLFTSLIVEPLSGLSGGELSGVELRQPVVVVIDAVDECGGLEGPRSNDRKALLKTLDQWHSELPKNFKLVVTSREEDDIKRRISPLSTHIHISITTDEASGDIRKYLEDRLRDIASAYSELPVDWAHQTANHLAKRAAGVFIWATTIASFIEAGEPQSQLEDIEAGLGLGGEEGSLYALYANVLRISFKNLRGKQMEAFKCVVGAMVFAQRPFHDSEFTAISPVVTGSMLEYIRNGLRSVIDQGATLRFIHQSFVDFLLSPECPDEFAIKEAEQQRQLSTLCLTTMSKRLRFNICGLETSSLKNADVPDIETKVKTGIPPLLSYASCFVAEHLCHTPFDERLMNDVRVVFKEKLLYWLEAMSLLKEMHLVVPSLRMVVDWIAARDRGLTEFIRDALRFVTAFTIPIIQSAPHIYLSALPFAPEESLVAKYFLARFPQLLALDTGKPSYWSSCVFVSEHHRMRVNAIALSPDEKIFASVDLVGEICIWDSETGILISGPLISYMGHHLAFSLAFSPDGKYLVATYGEGGMVIWDVESGKEHLCFGGFSHGPGFSPLHGDTLERIISAVYSKDGHMIVSISDCIATRYANYDSRCRVRLWDASIGTPAHILLDLPASGYACLLSPDAHFLASWSDSHPAPPLRVWDLTERPPRVVVEQNAIDEESSRSLAFSTDGKFLLAAARIPDRVCLAHIWRMDTYTLARPAISLGPAFGHCVLYSCGYNGLAIGVHGTVLTKIFDATTGDVVYCGEQPTGVWSCSPSRNGRKIVLGYDDGTIRMWDYRCHTQVSPVIDLATDDDPKRLDRLTTPVFSPCGGTLAVSYKNEIKLFNTTTGEPINLNYPIRTESTEISFSGDGRYLASLQCIHKKPIAINVWEVGTGMNHRHLVVTCAPEEKFFYFFFASSDNRLVLHSSSRGEEEKHVVRIWGVDVLDEPCTTATLVFPETTRSRLVLSPDTLTALIRLEDTSNVTTFHFHHRNSIEEQFAPHALFDSAALGPEISCEDGWATFSPSGRLFASVPDHTEESLQIRVWETKTWTEIAGPFEAGEIPSSPFSRSWPKLLSISPDDCLIRFVSPQDGAIWVWDIHTGQRVAGPWRGYDLRQAINIFMSPDGDKLASTHWGESLIVRLWDTRGLCSGRAQEPVGGIGDFGDQSLIEDGWVKEEGSDSLLFWVPVEHREGLWRPRNITILEATLTKLNFSRFKYGREWEECIDKE
ncbi:hypothetical protein D9756_002772 [Leucocoprinus leucothites]|uniref:Nephrocystin 3-like N-terminal domain-containing protein n=1 Tax=Leucocoprinus leucothites TaxID=201217 RepID=A0A8H5GCD2_9AGAR|nr:hypothetical protein D9756_002772 [Leucoagaricus leucothites]